MPLAHSMKVLSTSDVAATPLLRVAMAFTTALSVAALMTDEMPDTRYSGRILEVACPTESEMRLVALLWSWDTVLGSNQSVLKSKRETTRMARSSEQ